MCFHLAARYDLLADEEALRLSNVDGTRNLVVGLRAAGFRGVLHHVSSVAVAGDYSGEFPEDELELGQGFAHAYHRTKYESERIVRAVHEFGWRVYRPSAVVGHSQTGEMGRLDGPYFLMRAIQRSGRALPQWVTLPGIDAGPVNMVPVDFVADALARIALLDGLDGKDVSSGRSGPAVVFAHVQSHRRRGGGAANLEQTHLPDDQAHPGSESLRRPARLAPVHPRTMGGRYGDSKASGPRGQPRCPLRDDERCGRPSPEPICAALRRSRTSRSSTTTTVATSIRSAIARDGIASCSRVGEC